MVGSDVFIVLVSCPFLLELLGVQGHQFVPLIPLNDAPQYSILAMKTLYPSTLKPSSPSSMKMTCAAATPPHLTPITDSGLVFHCFKGYNVMAARDGHDWHSLLAALVLILTASQSLIFIPAGDGYGRMYLNDFSFDGQEQWERIRPRHANNATLQCAKRRSSWTRSHSQRREGNLRVSSLAGAWNHLFMAAHADHPTLEDNSSASNDNFFHANVSNRRH